MIGTTSSGPCRPSFPGSMGTNHAQTFTRPHFLMSCLRGICDHCHQHTSRLCYTLCVSDDNASVTPACPSASTCSALAGFLTLAPDDISAVHTYAGLGFLTSAPDDISAVHTYAGCGSYQMLIKSGSDSGESAHERQFA